MEYTIEAIYKDPKHAEESLKEVRSLGFSYFGPPKGLPHEMGFFVRIKDRESVIKLMKSLDDKCQLTITNVSPKSL